MWLQHNPLEAMGPSSQAVEGATTKAVFETYVERVLAPTLILRASRLPPTGSIAMTDALGSQLSNKWCRFFVWRNGTFPVLSTQGKGRGFFRVPRPLFGTRYARAKLPRLRFGPNLTA
jgi:hypothetical protein